MGVGSKMKRKIVVFFSFTLIVVLSLTLALPRQIGPQLEEYYAKNEVVTEKLQNSFTTLKPKMTHNKTEAVPAMISNAGYPVETHTVTTEDCYILQMHRIPHGKNMVQDIKSRPVV